MLHHPKSWYTQPYTSIRDAVATRTHKHLSVHGRQKRIGMASDWVCPIASHPGSFHKWWDFPWFSLINHPFIVPTFMAFPRWDGFCPDLPFRTRSPHRGLSMRILHRPGHGLESVWHDAHLVSGRGARDTWHGSTDFYWLGEFQDQWRSHGVATKSSKKSLGITQETPQISWFFLVGSHFSQFCWNTIGTRDVMAEKRSAEDHCDHHLPKRPAGWNLSSRGPGPSM